MSGVRGVIGAVWLELEREGGVGERQAATRASGSGRGGKRAVCPSPVPSPMHLVMVEEGGRGSGPRRPARLAAPGQQSLT